MFLYSLLQTIGSFLFCSSATQVVPRNYISTDNYVLAHMTSMSVQTREGAHTHTNQGAAVRVTDKANHRVIIWCLVTAIYFPESLEKASKWVRSKE